MDIIWNTTVVNPQELMNISRGDKNRMLKYLYQFQTLIPLRIEALKESLKNDDRKMVRQLLHQMSPQLQFFGIEDVVQPIRRLEHEYATIPIEDLHALVNSIINKLDRAIKDVDSILKDNF
ncbi:MAG: HPt (histidine-containing phosphotransfer) domain-containing protein [Ulvibacter sp.]|jgi:HPt (histidine-containing phosphotransfer) domain-containing protein